MNESNIQHVGIMDFLSLSVSLIAEDLKVQKHLYWLSQGGLDSSPMNLELHKIIFTLIGIKNTDLVEEAKEWYFQKVQESFSTDIFNDKDALTEISAEILKGLDRFRMKGLDKSKS